MIKNKFFAKKWVFYLITVIFILLNIVSGTFLFLNPESFPNILLKFLGLTWILEGLLLFPTLKKIYNKESIDNKITGKWSWFF
jgi:hypothetical protein